MQSFQDKLTKLMQASKPAWAGLNLGHAEEANSRLQEISGFGPNPGALRLFCHVPAVLPTNSPLVVVLHGCTQTAAGYDVGSGWSALADRYGFAVLIPQQQRANNPNGCFNWFQPGDTRRGQGEARSIREMVERMVVDHQIDRRRIFITGLSAGGAMTSVMLAVYPEIFAGGAIIAGLPYGAASNVPQALASMKQGPSRSPAEWGDLVRSASPHQGPWPRISVWHGSADRTVTPSNAAEIVKQWTNLHGTGATPDTTQTVNGYPRQVWRNAAGEEVIESYSITRMAHGTPLAAGDEVDQGGTAGAFLLEVGISSTYHIAKFWGLARPVPATAAADVRVPRVGATRPQPEPRSNGSNAEVEDRPGAGMDIGAIITRALTAAGLMKGR